MIKDAIPTEEHRKLQAGLCIKGIDTGTKRLREIVDDMIDVSDLSIANPAPRLESKYLPRLGERFFRIGTNDEGSHAGLGLSLAATIAKVLRLSFRLTLRDDGCLVVAVGRFRALAAPGGTE